MCDYDSADDAYASEEEAEGVPGKSGWQTRKEREAELLGRNRPQLVHLFISCSPAADEIECRGRLVVTAAVQQQVDSLATEQPCMGRPLAVGGAGNLLQCVAMPLQHPTWHSTIYVPAHSCKHAQCPCRWQKLLLHPLKLGYFDAQGEGTTWFSLDVLESFRVLNTLGGVGATGEASALLERNSAALLMLLVKHCNSIESCN